MASQHMNVTLVEQYSTGHHTEYLLHVISEFKGSNVSIHFVGCPQLCHLLKGKVASASPVTLDSQGHFIQREYNKVKFIKEVFSLAKQQKSDLVHFVYIDRLIRALYCMKHNCNVPVVATLHWAYMLSEFNTSIGRKLSGKVERFLLNRLFKKGLKLITHSPKVAKAFNQLKAYSAYALNYPIAHHYTYTEQGRQKVRQALNINKNDKLLLCFGGTRADKGADVAVEALNQLPDEYHLLIAGQEQDYSYDYLNNIACLGQKEQQLHFVKEFIPDEEVANIFSAADIVLLPYKENFAGQSGPLTIAASIGVPLLSSDVGVLRETIDKYHLGVCVSHFRAHEMMTALNSLDIKLKYRDNTFLTESSVHSFSMKTVKVYNACLVNSEN
ncbi:glycosyltransferase family 4 protein [Thalassotalea atypica]|uniref:glycosyltransferase family 4 protein n=1 Tax=Thalassotalea atypica TaxID=2054316 RepID=UPI0025740EE4|nr:glycosyltransferase family 4 protein [Thalassotalea atypica]